MHQDFAFVTATGRETLLDEELTEEQVEEELAPVTVQLAYTAAQLGRTEEALTTYEVCCSPEASEIEWALNEATKWRMCMTCMTCVYCWAGGCEGWC
jgi:hypothetical protein